MSKNIFEMLYKQVFKNLADSIDDIPLLCEAVAMVQNISTVCENKGRIYI